MARADAPRRQRPEEGPQRGYTRCGPFILSDPTVPGRAPDNLFPALRLQCSSCGAEGDGLLRLRRHLSASALARRRFAVSENQLWRSDANPTFARGPETIADGERSLRVCQVRKPDGLLDLHSRAPRKKRRATIVQDSALCVWPPSFWMETKFERPYRLFADMG